MQPIVVKADGSLDYAATQSITSKNFTGTTKGGYSSSSVTWQWTPSNVYGLPGYEVTTGWTGDNTHTNASAVMKHPTNLWNYDTTQYQFVGFGKNSWGSTVQYQVDETHANSADLFEIWSKNSYLVSTTSQTIYTYILQEKASPEEPPTAPDDSTVKDLLDGAVTVHCTNEAAGHADRTYGAIDGGYSLGEVTSSEDGCYTIAVSINSAVYAGKYAADLGVAHTLDPADQSHSITLEYLDGAWQLAAGQGATVTVVCSTSEEPGGTTNPDDTTKPDDTKPDDTKPDDTKPDDTTNPAGDTTKPAGDTTNAGKTTNQGDQDTDGSGNAKKSDVELPQTGDWPGVATCVIAGAGAIAAALGAASLRHKE